MSRTETLAELKGESVRLRSKIKASKGTLQDVLDLNVKRRAIKSIEKWLLAITVCLMLALSGCKAGVGVGADVDLYWPNIKTAKGGEFSDPDESREHSTQHTTGMARNNLPMVNGGAK